MGQGIRQLFLLLALDIYTQMSVGQEISLKYDLLEQQSRETFVGNVAVDSLLKANVTQEELERMKFQILTQGSKDASYFMIDEKSSTIKTASVLDREVLCEFEVVCVLEFSVAVYKQDQQHSNQLDLFKIFAIKVNILDANDNAPTFPQSQVALDVQESVPVDFVLLTSGAVDPDMGRLDSPVLKTSSPACFSLGRTPSFTDPFDFRIVTIIGRPFLTAIQRRLFVFCNHTKRFNHRLFQTNCYNTIQTLQFFKLSR